SAIDGFFTDDYMVPPGHEDVLSERVVRLGRSPLVYRPPDGMPAVGDLPAKRNGYVTFGSFSRTVRLNEKVIALWSELLKMVPNAILVLNSKPFAEEASRKQFEARFAANGIGAERLKLIYTSPQPNTWAYYNEIDIALDPFPHNAGTTTIEALWMGVPVISKADRPTVGRFGASILGALGMSDWVAETPEQYVEIAARWASDLGGLAKLRSNLRPRFQASALSDGPGLVKAIEAGYRKLWQEWCNQPPLSADILYRQAVLDAQSNRPKVALALCRRILEQQADHADTLRLAAICADKLGQGDEAAEYFSRALPFFPKKLNLAMSYANLLQRLQRWAEAEAVYRQRLQYHDPLVSLNYSVLLIQQGSLREAEAVCRQALAAYPDSDHAVALHSNLLFCLNYRADIGPDEIREEYKSWDARHGRPKLPNPLIHGNDRTPDRRLKIGYVSPDFRHHAVAMFFEPLLVSRDRDAFEVYLYGEVANPDATTQRLRGLADHWRGTVGKSDDEVAAQIRADGIDILVDLAGHTAGNRLPVFARKPAPVQFAYLIGQGTTTG
ncbi:tetratricopeptide repeat protein, partial [Ferrovibrio sp.]|uniref:O-linked N-acetylglucosamine transferase family protein n=1 Tax=Ferrovibrio sp. TaxID=1917215 RepID=UPI0025BBC5A7